MNCVKVSTKKALAFIGTAQIGRQRPGYVLWAALVSSFVWLAPQVSLALQGPVTVDATVPIKTSATHGTDMTLRLEADSSDASNVFVKFNLTSSLPPGSTATDISRATLKLFVGKLHGNVSLVHRDRPVSRRNRLKRGHQDARLHEAFSVVRVQFGGKQN